MTANSSIKDFSCAPRHPIGVFAGNPSTKHDNSVALYLDGDIYALAAERIDRVKHSMNAQPAFEHLSSLLAESLVRCDVRNRLSNEYQPHDSLDHHLAHAYGAFVGSPFDEAAILVADGMGPSDTQFLFSSVSLWQGRGDTVSLLARTLEPYPCFSSLGHFYAAINYYLGFDFFDACYAMSIASYGDREVFKAHIDELVRFDDEKLVITDSDFIRFSTAFRFPECFGCLLSDDQRLPLLERYSNRLGPPRLPKEDLRQRHYDIAAAAQWRLEEVLCCLLNRLHAITGSTNLCYTGGVALNCKANAAVLPSSPFTACYIPPAADDTGQSVGRLYYNLVHDFGIRPPPIDTAFLGPKYSARQIAETVAKHDRFVNAHKLSRTQISESAAAALANSEVVGWFCGRSEFGPRALGHRSILADARSPDARSWISERFKLREPFRPFAPSVLVEDCSEYFEVPTGSCFPGTAFMQYAVPVTDKGNSLLPAAVHVDGTSRLQTVSTENVDFYRMIQSFKRMTGVGVVVNTSFNASGMPLIETPTHAIEALLSSRLDRLFLEDWCLTRKRS